MAVVRERWKHGGGVATYAKGLSAGALATESWLSARGLYVPPRTPWEVSISLDIVDESTPTNFVEIADTRLRVTIASTEWGFSFCHHSRASWIRVTDVPFVHERDDYLLLAQVPPLRELGRLVRSLEETYRIRFRRGYAMIRSTIGGAEPVIRAWVVD